MAPMSKVSRILRIVQLSLEKLLLVVTPDFEALGHSDPSLGGTDCRHI